VDLGKVSPSLGLFPGEAGISCSTVQKAYKHSQKVNSREALVSFHV